MKPKQQNIYQNKGKYHKDLTATQTKNKQTSGRASDQVVICFSFESDWL